MMKVEVYVTNTCPHCGRAKALLDRKGVGYTIIDLTGDDEGRDALVERAGGLRTVPQIFINDIHVGGADDLYGLEKTGELDKLLSG